MTCTIILLRSLGDQGYVFLLSSFLLSIKTDHCLSVLLYLMPFLKVALLTPLRVNALQTEGRRTV